MIRSRAITAALGSIDVRASEAEGKNVTWSDAEYAHVGLQTQYLKLKSCRKKLLKIWTLPGFYENPGVGQI